MRVIGAGFGRTGTTSLKAALEELGYSPAYSLGEVFENPEHVEVWEAAHRGERIDWKKFLSNYEVTVDWPACYFYEELMVEFPEAKVILTVRGPERWYESISSTIYLLRKITGGPLPVRAAIRLAGLFAPGPVDTARLADRLVWEDTFDGRFEDRAYAMKIFERGNEAVRRRTPPERLLVFDVREGWEPLCNFLGVKVPDRPFPYLNQTREMRRRLLGIAVLSIAPMVLAAIVSIGVALFARRLAAIRRRTE